MKRPCAIAAPTADGSDGSAAATEIPPVSASSTYGERQRVAIARALVGRPAIVFADEPTGNLDSRTSEGILALLHELHGQGATILVITHEREIAAAFPRRIALRDGRVESDSGTPRLEVVA